MEISEKFLDVKKQSNPFSQSLVNSSLTLFLSEADKIERALKFYTLWRSVQDSPPAGGVFYQLEYPNTVAMAKSNGKLNLSIVDVEPPLGDGVPDVLWKAGHLHLHVDAGGNCPE